MKSDMHYISQAVVKGHKPVGTALKTLSPNFPHKDTTMDAIKSQVQALLREVKPNLTALVHFVNTLNPGTITPDRLNVIDSPGRQALRESCTAYLTAYSHSPADKAIEIFSFDFQHWIDLANAKGKADLANVVQTTLGATTALGGVATPSVVLTAESSVEEEADTDLMEVETSEEDLELIEEDDLDLIEDEEPADDIIGEADLLLAQSILADTEFDRSAASSLLIRLGYTNEDEVHSIDDDTLAEWIEVLVIEGSLDNESVDFDEGLDDEDADEDEDEDADEDADDSDSIEDLLDGGDDHYEQRLSQAIDRAMSSDYLPSQLDMGTLSIYSRLHVILDISTNDTTDYTSLTNVEMEDGSELNFYNPLRNTETEGFGYAALDIVANVMQDYNESNCKIVGDGATIPLAATAICNNIAATAEILATDFLRDAPEFVRDMHDAKPFISLDSYLSSADGLTATVDIFLTISAPYIYNLEKLSRAHRSLMHFFSENSYSMDVSLYVVADARTILNSDSRRKLIQSMEAQDLNGLEDLAEQMLYADCDTDDIDMVDDDGFEEDASDAIHFDEVEDETGSDMEVDTEAFPLVGADATALSKYLPNGAAFVAFVGTLQEAEEEEEEDDFDGEAEDE